MEKPTLRERIRYWLDNRIAGGTSSMMLLLFIATVLIVIVASVLICIIDPDSSWHITAWNNTTTVVNRWMPEVSDEGDLMWIPYIIRALVAIAGLFITSFLISILSAGMEGRIQALRVGRRKLLEKGHIVILGADDADIYLNEIKEYAENRKLIVLIADELETEEYEKIISYSKDLPKNVKLYVKNLDIGRTEDLEMCSIPEASAVIIHGEDEDKTVQSVLAVSKILKDNPQAKTVVVAGVKSYRRILPKDTLDPRIQMIQISSVGIKMMMRCCSNRGLADAMIKFISFSKNKICRDQIPELDGKTFGTIANSAHNIISMGIQRGDRKILMPSQDTVLEPGDKLIYFGGGRKFLNLGEIREAIADTQETVLQQKSEKVVLIGDNPFLKRAIDYLPVRYEKVVMVPRREEEREHLAQVAKEASEKMAFADIDPFVDKQLLAVIQDADQVVLSVGTGENAESVEADNIVLLNRIRSLADREKLRCLITLAVNSGKWMELKHYDERVTVFNLRVTQALILLQAALNVETRDLLLEILQNDDHAMSIRTLGELGFAEGEYSVVELRQKARKKGVLFVGYVKRSENHVTTILNPAQDGRIELTSHDDIIVFS